MSNDKIGANLREFRKSKNMTVEAFWKPVGVTKSAGSRYETSDRTLPEPVRNLLFTIYGFREGMTQEDPNRRVHVSAEEADIVEFLRNNPDILTMIKKLRSVEVTKN